MSSAVVSTSAALGRPFLFDAEPEPERPLSNASEHTGMRESLLARFQSTIKNQQSNNFLPVLRPCQRCRRLRPQPLFRQPLDRFRGSRPRSEQPV